MTMTAQEILEARITYLAYAPGITTIIDARKRIVDGAVGMVEMALERLNEGELVELDEERKAAMVSNLLVVLCGNHDAQPIVNTGSLYQEWLIKRKSKFHLDCQPSYMLLSHHGQKMIFDRSMVRSSTC